ncbi:MAG TPA: hypothetical protein VKP69_03750, partial [Isosphaeraceae bacterium]|nr:hypothetical protein [Isosphaeraceae bacterium]
AEAAAERQRQLGFRFLVAAIVAGVLAVTSSGLALWTNNARQAAHKSEEKATDALKKALAETKRADEAAELAKARAKIAESRRLAALSDSVRATRLDQAMLLALEATGTDTLEARGSLQRCLDDRPEVSRFLDIPEGDVWSVAFGPGGTIAAGYERGGGGGVVLLDGDPASWRAKAGQVANRNFTRGEWRQFFPDTSYRRTIRSFPWPHDLPEAERKQAEAWEKEHPVVRDASRPGPSASSASTAAESWGGHGLTPGRQRALVRPLIDDDFALRFPHFFDALPALDLMLDNPLCRALIGARKLGDGSLPAARTPALGLVPPSGSRLNWAHSSVGESRRGAERH